MINWVRRLRYRCKKFTKVDLDHDKLKVALQQWKTRKYFEKY